MYATQVHEEAHRPLATFHSHINTVLEMAQTSWGTQLATITPPEMNHLLLISALSSASIFITARFQNLSLFSSHFHKSLLIDP